MDYKFSQSIDFKPLIVFMNNISNFRNYFGHKVSFVYILYRVYTFTPFSVYFDDGKMANHYFLFTFVFKT